MVMVNSLYFYKLKNFFSKNYILSIIFVLSTLFFMYQHYVVLSWDFSAYVLNAKYLFYDGNYFETIRPPLVPFFLGIFLIFGVFGEYLYILFTSVLFLYFNIKISDLIVNNIKFTVDKIYFRCIFYIFSLSSFVLFYGAKEGSELLGLTFFMAFIYFLFKGKVSGYFLGLTFLVRYNFLIFLPLLFFNKSIKKVALNLLSFFLVVLPWFIFNYFIFGNPFVSIINSYALNFTFKDYLFQSFQFLDLKTIIGFSLPFFFFGLLLSIFYLYRNKYLSRGMILLFFGLFLFTLYDYIRIPYKLPRYLFNFSFPLAFFSSIGFLFICRFFKKERKTFFYCKFFLIMFFIINLITAGVISQNESSFSKILNSAGKDIVSLNISHCEVLTPYWTQISYFSDNARPLGKNDVEYSLKNNKIILLFKNAPTIDDNYNLSYLETKVTLKETNDYAFYVGENFRLSTCYKSQKYVENYFIDVCPFISDRFDSYSLSNLSSRLCLFFNRNS